MQYSTRLPATPLITHDPYFSIWAPGDTPTAEDTVHWSGIRKILRGSILIDGTERGFLSRSLRQAMRCVDTRVTPLSTEYILEELGVRLSVKFTSPLLLDDPDLPRAYARRWSAGKRLSRAGHSPRRPLHGLRPEAACQTRRSG